MSNKRNHRNNESEPLFFGGEIEIRKRAGGEGEEIFGYWALYNQRSAVMTTKKGVKFVEELQPGVFDRTDFSGLESRFDHDRFLASSPTLRHGVDSRGGWYAIDFDPGDPDHVSVRRKIERGDAKGSSFEFAAPGPNDQTVVDEGGIKLRKIHHIAKVYEVGPVVNPAYPSTTTFVRSLDEQHDEDLQAQENFNKRKIEARKFLEKALS